MEKERTYKEDFQTEVQKVKGSIPMLEKFENDKLFMEAFQNQFINASLKPDVVKYWKRSCEDYDEGFKQMYSIRKTGFEKRLDKLSIEFDELIRKDKVPEDCFTDLKPDVVKYWKRSCEDYDKGVMLYPIREKTGFEKRLDKLRIEFDELIRKDKVPEDCLTHDIKQTNIYQQFQKVQDTVEEFKKMEDFVDLQKEVEEFGFDIIWEVKEISYHPIKERLIEAIVNDDENHMNIFLSKSPDKFEKDYKKAKRRLNRHLKRHLNDVLSSKKEIQRKQSQPKTLSERITHVNSDKIVEGIKIQFKDFKGKRLSLLLKALRELNLFPTGRTDLLFHDCCKNELNWDVGSYQAMNGCTYKDSTDKQPLEDIKQNLKKWI